jgi:cytochrome c oxidase assembly protein subunit 15
MATVQFDHRLGAWILAVVAPIAWWRVMRAGVGERARVGAHLVLGMLAVQVALGIATLLAVVPLTLAAAHQAGAVVLFALALNLAHALAARSAVSASDPDEASSRV